MNALSPFRLGIARLGLKPQAGEYPPLQGGRLSWIRELLEEGKD
jgi:hypothetical protein